MNLEEEINDLKSALNIYKKIELIRWCLCVVAFFLLTFYFRYRAETNKYNLERNFKLNGERIDSIKQRLK